MEVLLRSRAELLSASAVLSALALVITAPLAIAFSSFGVWSGLFLTATVTCSSVSWALSQHNPSPGSVRVEDGTLHVEHARATESTRVSSLRDAQVVATHDDHVAVELTLRDGRVLHVPTDSWDDAWRWLDDASIASHRRATTFRLGTRAQSFVWAVIGLVLLGPLVTFIVGLLPYMMFLRLGVTNTAALTSGDVALWLASAWVIWRWGRPATVLVGVDGVALRGVFTTRFVPMSDVASASVASDGAFVLTRLDGRSFSLSPNDSKHPGARQAAFAIAQMQRRASRSSRAVDLTMLDRRGRDAAAWREAMSSLSTSTAAFRGVTPDRQALLAVLDEPGADVERRVAAVLALRGDEAAQSRVRVAVDACSDEPSRDAMRAALDGTLADHHLARLPVRSTR